MPVTARERPGMLRVRMANASKLREIPRKRDVLFIRNFFISFTKKHPGKNNEERFEDSLKGKGTCKWPFSNVPKVKALSCLLR